MKKFSLKVLLFMVIFLIVLGVLSTLLFKELLCSIVLNIISSIIAGIFIWVFGKLSKNKELLLLEANLFFKHKNEKIRMSMSYIFRIKVDSKYLLVKGRNNNCFQPVGGVYKFFEEGIHFLRKINFSPECGSIQDEKTRNDLRISIPSKYVVSFLEWFSTGKEREYDIYREFYEELIEKTVLPNDFGIITYKYLGFTIGDLHYSNQYKMHEILGYDLFELIPSNSQLDFLLESIEKTSDYFRWVTSEEIKQRYTNDNKQIINISDNSIWLI